MANEFESWGPSAILPNFLLGTWGTKWGSAQLYLLDRLVRGVKEAVTAAFVATCPPDAVPYHAASRMIEPLDTETLEALRARVLDAWVHWSGGNANDLRDKLIAYTGATDLLVQTYAENGFALDDVTTAGASRIWILIGTAGVLPWSRPAVGAGLVVGSTTLVGITMTPSELSRIRRICKRYKPGHMVGAEVFVSFDTPASGAVGSDDVIRLALQWPMVGYDSSEMTVGPALVVGQEYA